MAQKKILIVDDEKNLTIALESFFKHKGHSIYIANSGETALGLLKKEKIDLLLLDLNMPGVDGIEVAKAVKKSYPHTKILVLTAYSDEYKDRLASIRPEEVMTKPFGVLTLINKVGELLGEETAPSAAPEPVPYQGPVKVLIVSPMEDRILKDYALPYIRLSWGRNIEIGFIGSSEPGKDIKEKILSFKPDIVLLSVLGTKEAEDLSKCISENIYRPKEVVIYTTSTDEEVKKNRTLAYAWMQQTLMDPEYLNRLNELLKDTAIKHNLIDKTAFRRERPALAASAKKEDIAGFVKEAIVKTLNLKEIDLTDETSFIEDLGVDSLDTIELVMELEEVFGFEMPDEDAQKLKTVGEAIEYIKKRAKLEDVLSRHRPPNRILVVDDQKGICEFLENYFTSKGYDVTTATDAKRALELLKKEKPAVVLLDIRMPDTDGIELLKKIKNQDPLVKVIMVSVASEREYEARQCGADGFVSKPFPITYLEKEVIKKIKELTC